MPEGFEDDDNDSVWVKNTLRSVYTKTVGQWSEQANEEEKKKHSATGEDQQRQGKSPSETANYDEMETPTTPMDDI